MVRNGQTSAGRKRWRCPACGASLTRRRSRRPAPAGGPGPERVADFELFLGYVTTHTTQAQIGQGNDRAVRRRISWCWKVPTPPPPPAQRGACQLYIDAMYLAGSWCLLIARDDTHVLAWQWAASETAAAYTALLERLQPPDLVTTDGAGEP